MRAARTPNWETIMNQWCAIIAGCCCALSAAHGQSNDNNEDEAPFINEQKSRLFWKPAPIDEPLVTDRPDFTESTDAVPLGRFQFEGGYTFTHDGGTDTHQAPELLLRVGVFEGVELRIGWPNFTSQDADSGIPDVDGLEDLSLGVKVKLIEQDGAIPHFGVIGEISIPTGADDLSSGDVDPAIKLLWAYDINDRLSLGGNVNFASLTENNDRFFQVAASVALGVSITERVGAYIEYFGEFPMSDGGGPAHYLNGGATYLITNNFQLDARLGFGLNGRADDLFTGAGFAIRF